MVSLSIIIATCGRPERLRVTLEHVGRALRIWGGESEIIVVDNHPAYGAERVVGGKGEEGRGKREGAGGKVVGGTAEGERSNCEVGDLIPEGGGNVEHRTSNAQPLISDPGPRTPGHIPLSSSPFPLNSELRTPNFKLTYLRSTPFNKAKALNAGIAAAKSEWLVFTDDDTLPDPDWLVCGAQYAERSGLRVFGGRVIAGEDPPELPTWLRSGRSGRVPDIGVHVRYEPLTASGLVQSHQMAPLGANMFCCRDVFAEYGGYDEELWDLCKARWSLGCEDSEFGHRLKLRGEPIGYCREAVVVHPVNAERASIRLHLRRAYSEGWRQPLIFTEECRPWFEPFRVRSLVMFAVGAVRDVWRRDWAGAMERLVEMVRTCGGIAGRWSGVYRARMKTVWNRSGGVVYGGGRNGR